MKLVLLFILIFQAYSLLANVEQYADDIFEARVLVDVRNDLKVVKVELSEGLPLDRQKLSELELTVEEIAEKGCDCPKENNMIRAQAYALIGTINGIISKETNSFSHGKKSYQTLGRARELDPRNVDAIRGQGEAIKAILSKGPLTRMAVSKLLGINLRSEQKKLILDLRTFKDNTILQRLADQLEKL